jgi:hypothetical protein
MGRLAASRELVETMGRAGRAFAETFTWDAAATQTEGHLRDVAWTARASA